VLNVSTHTNVGGSGRSYATFNPLQPQPSMQRCTQNVRLLVLAGDSILQARATCSFFRNVDFSLAGSRLTYRELNSS
jgi:hypothetical protein